LINQNYLKKSAIASLRTTFTRESSRIENAAAIFFAATPPILNEFKMLLVLTITPLNLRRAEHFDNTQQINHLYKDDNKKHSPL